MTSSRRTRLAAAGIVLCAVTMGLSGCFAGDPTSNSSQGQGQPTAPSASPTTSPSAKIDAQMTIASVDVNGQNVSVSGYVSGIVEDGGTCTYTATSSSGTTLTITATGISNVRTTSCGTSQEPISSFSKGSWKVALHYASSTGDVTSEPIDLEIP